MSKQIFFLFFTLSISVILYCQTVEGYWRGAVSRDGSIQITELLIEKNAGGLKALYSLPDLGLFEQSADLVFKTDTSFTLKIFMGVFECLLHEDIQEVTGVNNNWKPVGLKLHLKKMSTPPKSYTQTLVDVKAATGTTLKGTLFTPTRTGKRPLVIIAHGAENPTRTNWVYTSYAYFLAEQGFAVYVFDQRAHGLSGGSTEATLEDHAADIISIAAFFSKASFIDQRNISILGESRGGWAAVLAAARSKIFSSIVLLAGPAKSPIDLEPDVVFATLKKDGYSASAIDSAMRYTDLYFKTVKDSGLYTRLTQQYEVIKNRPWAHVLQTPEREGLLWWKKNNLNTPEMLEKVKANVLAIFGTEDNLVPYQQNASLMEKSLASSRKKFAVHVIKGLPHGIFFYQTLKGNQFYWPSDFWVWPKRSIEMDKLIVDFINAPVK